MLKLLSLQECDLLEKAADAVGKKGLNGRNTPAALPFFVFALRITQLAEDSHYSNITITQRYKRKSYMHCRCTCPPCQNDKCIGLCGKGCRCWKWLCNDCCWHRGCYDHDLCCKKSWLHHRCLFPIKFRCNRPYKCWQHMQHCNLMFYVHATHSCYFPVMLSNTCFIHFYLFRPLFSEIIFFIKTF